MTQEEKADSTTAPPPPPPPPPAGTETDGGAADLSVPDPSADGFFFDLCVLPPCRQGFPESTEGLIRLPPIRGEEPVSSLRAALSEVRGLAHITQYRLELDTERKGAALAAPSAPPALANHQHHNSNHNGGSGKKGGRKKKKNNKNSQNNNNSSHHHHNGFAVHHDFELVSPFTGPDAVVRGPRDSDSDSDGKVRVLDDYGDLSNLDLENGAAFRMVLERYDAAAVRDHVVRLRSILDGNVPHVDTLYEEKSEETEDMTTTKEETTTTKEETTTKEDGDTKKKDDAATSKKDAATETPKDDDVVDNQTRQRELRERASAAHRKRSTEKPPVFPPDRAVALDGTDLADFYHLSCGEEDGSNDDDVDDGPPPRTDCVVRWSGFHPPPPHRRLLNGDLAYLEIDPTGDSSTTIHVTATPLGFYVNGCTRDEFDPSPLRGEDACYSHALLDCLLRRSRVMRESWGKALTAAKEKASLAAKAAAKDSPIQALHRVATRSSSSNGRGGNAGGIDSIVLRPSWLIPPTAPDAWGRDRAHVRDDARAEDDLTNTHGLDVAGGGALRDWNEELQSAREMPTGDLAARVDRARLVHKVLSDFGEAVLLGAAAIAQGRVAPMNPNEPARGHVYLHNNIFFSRAVDAGADTFKVSRGDRAARKSASRDAQCMGVLHRLDVMPLHTLATVLVDHLGTRLVCQSIVPGILHGERTHTLLYGAVEATAPLVWDEDMHALLEKAVGKGLMVASRKVPTFPLSEEKMELIRRIKAANPLPGTTLATEETKENEKGEVDPTTLVCGPVEAKGIKGSDQRSYVLDLTRLTPRDANWVPEEEGGTGNWEKVLEESDTKAQKYVPKSVADDEWTMAVLRPELITHLTHQKMSEYMLKKKEEESKTKKTSADKDKEASKDGSTDKPTDSKPTEGNDAPPKKEKPEPTLPDKIVPAISAPGDVSPLAKIDAKPEDEEYLNSLRYNLNVFLPQTKSLRDIGDAEGQTQHDSDAQRVRDASNHLWNTFLPTMTKEMRDNSNFSAHQIPVDGASLTETLHLRGVNCRYLGRLAQLAIAEEKKDRDTEAAVVASGKAAAAATAAGETKKKPLLLPRKTMPLCWLELLECEMVARAAKHVLDDYLTENGGAAATMPAQTIASFLSALLSTREETAAETENRVGKSKGAGSGKGVPLEDELSALVLSYGGGGGNSVPNQIRGRAEVWNDIETEVGRRFRYSLTLYNKDGSSSSSSNLTKGKAGKSRALMTPLLRRVCQRTGIRIVAKKYDLGGKCLCSTSSSAGTPITASYPISPVDIVDIVPLVKHAASHGGEGFVPCTTSSAIGSSPVVSISSFLHILLSDAKATFEAAHVHWSARSLPRALELAQEAASLYQRVVDTPLHASVSRCLDLTAVILFQAQEPELAAANASRALAVAVQLGGFDCAEALTAHTTLAHILISSGGLAAGVKHLRASLYLMELLAGPRYAELVNVYHKLGTMYHEMGNGISALRFYQEASQRQVSDRMVEGMISKSTALVLASMGQFKAALDHERRTYGIYRLILGEEHEMTQTSANTLKQFMKLAVEQGTRLLEEEKKRAEVEAAEAVASKIESDELEEEGKKKKKKKKKSKKKA